MDALVVVGLGCASVLGQHHELGCEPGLVLLLLDEDRLGLEGSGLGLFEGCEGGLLTPVEFGLRDGGLVLERSRRVRQLRGAVVELRVRLGEPGSDAEGGEQLVRVLRGEQQGGGEVQPARSLLPGDKACDLGASSFHLGRRGVGLGLELRCDLGLLVRGILRAEPDRTGFLGYLLSPL